MGTAFGGKRRLNVLVLGSQDGDLHIHFKPGEQYLTGGQVLEYMRFRHCAEGDFGRMRRQQQDLQEIAREMAQPAQ